MYYYSHFTGGITDCRERLSSCDSVAYPLEKGQLALLRSSSCGSAAEEGTPHWGFKTPEKLLRGNSCEPWIV